MPNQKTNEVPEHHQLQDPEHLLELSPENHDPDRDPSPGLVQSPDPDPGRIQSRDLVQPRNRHLVRGLELLNLKHHRNRDLAAGRGQDRLQGRDQDRQLRPGRDLIHGPGPGRLRGRLQDRFRGLGLDRSLNPDNLRGPDRKLPRSRGPGRGQEVLVEVQVAVRAVASQDRRASKEIGFLFFILFFQFGFSKKVFKLVLKSTFDVGNMYCLSLCFTALTTSMDIT